MIPRRKLQEIDRLRRRREFDAALAQATELVERYPHDAEAWLKRAYVYSAMKKLDAAIADVTQAVVLEPEEPDPYFTRARWLLNTGRFEEAVVDLQTVLAIEQREGELYYSSATYLLLASSTFELGRLEDAREACAMVADNTSLWSRGGMLKKAELEKRIRCACDEG